MFMRLRRTVPQFTFILSTRFVNPISTVSTGFFRFFSVLFEIRHISIKKTQQIRKNLLPHRLRLASTLSQNEVSRLALTVFEKLDLRIKRTRKKLRLRLREHRKT